MAVTVTNLITNLDTYIGDTSTDRISTAERYQFLTEGTVWLQEELGNDHMIKTYTLPYFDSVYYYEVTTALASMLEGADLRREEQYQYQSFAHKSSRELAEEIGQKATESSWAIERKDNDAYLVINHKSRFNAQNISSMDSITADGGTWAVDSTNSDATNLTVDTVEYKEGSASFNFDVDVSQSGNNRATIQNSTLTSLDLSSYEDLASWLLRVYIPDVTYVSSYTLYWGSSTSDYWSTTVTTDINGNALADEWNRLKFTWSSATQTGTPDVEAIDFIRIDVNYTGSQTDDTDFRLDDLKLVRPENLTFHYTSWYVGTNSGGTNLVAYTAGTDVPFFSGQYDQYKFAVAHMAASKALYGPLQIPQLGQIHEVEAIKALNRVRKLIPASVTKETKSMKVLGVNFRRRPKRH